MSTLNYLDPRVWTALHIDTSRMAILLTLVSSQCQGCERTRIKAYNLVAAQSLGIASCSTDTLRLSTLTCTCAITYAAGKGPVRAYPLRIRHHERF